MAKASAMKLLRSFWNRYFGNANYRIWQCCELEHGHIGSACQRLKGHAGKHRGYHGEVWP